MTSNLLRRVRALLQRSGVQPAGWTVLGLAIGLLVLGGVLGWVELRIAGVVGAVVLVIGVLFMVGRQTYAVQLGLAEEYVVVGQPAHGRLIVRNTAARRLRGARLELPVGRQVASFTLPTLAALGEFMDFFAITTERRAVIEVGPARTVRGDPFALVGREVKWTDSIELYVHPPTVLLPGRPGGFIRDLEGHPTADLSNSDVAFHALRDYTSGDDRRFVHWRSTARTGNLMVRQFEETRRSHVAIGLDVGADSYFVPDEFELAVSIAGSLAVQTLREENALSMLASSGRLTSTSPRRVLDDLSGVQLGPGGGSQTTAQQLKVLVPHASVVIAVTGSSASTAQLRTLSRIFERSQRVLMVRADLAADELSVTNLDQVSLLTVPRLDLLPRAIRRAGL